MWIVVLLLSERNVLMIAMQEKVDAFDISFVAREGFALVTEQIGQRCEIIGPSSLS